MISSLKKMISHLTLRWKISSLVFLLTLSLMIGQHSPSDFVAGGVLSLVIYFLVKSFFGADQKETAVPSTAPSQQVMPTPQSQPWQVAPAGNFVGVLPNNLFSEMPAASPAPNVLDAAEPPSIPDVKRPPPTAAFRTTKFG